MAKKTDGITDLTKVLVTASKKFTQSEFKKLQHVIFAILHGVNYGYTDMDNRFLQDSGDLYFMHSDEKKFKKIKKIKKIIYKDNVINFKDFKREGITDDA